jgi:Mg-chelatase subunit ChlD
MEKITNGLMEFYDDNSTAIKIIGILFVLCIIASIIFVIIYNPVKIKYESDDAKVIATLPTKLDIKAYAYDKYDKRYNINWSVTGGKLNKDTGNEINWELPEEEGIYNLVATVGKKTFVKKVSVLKNELINFLENKEEKVNFSDADLDGLSDEYENTTSNTNPNLNDTDGDTIYDGNEIILGLDPNNQISKSDNVLDSDRELSYKVEDKENNVLLNILGNGNIANTTIDKYTTKTLKDLSEVVSDTYNIYSEGKIKNANIKIKYNKEVLKEKNINEDNLSLYKIAKENNDFEKIGTVLDKENSLISADVKSLGKFFIADSTKMKTNLSTELMFVIDNSGSMYSSEAINESKSNDVEFRRVDLSNNLIDKLQGNYKFGAVKFTFENTKLSSLVTDKEDVKKKISSIKTNTEIFSGTYIGNALNAAIEEFPNEITANRRFVILLTDGKDTTSVTGYNNKMLDEAVEKASSKKIKIFTIGLGEDIDKTILEKISTKTDGKFYYASNAKLLDSVFELISSQMNYNLLDMNDDKKDDSTLLADSGFVIAKDSFSFANFILKQNASGVTYGMTLFAKLYYEKNLPTNLSDMSVKVSNKKESQEETIKAIGYNINSSINMKNTDLIDYKFKDISFLNEDSKLLRQNKIVKGVLGIKTDTKTIVKSFGFLTYNQKYNVENKVFKNYENYYLDLESEGYIKKLNKSDREIINSLNRLDILKYRDEEYSFKDKSDASYKKMLENLKEDKPVLLKLNDNYTVLATRIVFDNENPNKQKIEVFDSNYKSKVRYIDLERVVINTKEKTTSKNTNLYNYKFKYNNTDVDVKLSIPNTAANL